MTDYFSKNSVVLLRFNGEKVTKTNNKRIQKKIGT